jgi:hypothetical protein
MKYQILIEPVNPVELPPEELAILAQEISDSLPDVSVIIGYEDEEGSGVTWVQLLHVFLPSSSFAKDYLYAKMLDRIFAFLKTRRKRPHQGTRTNNVVVHDETGKVIEIWSLKPGEDKAMVLPPDQDDIPRPKPSQRFIADDENDGSDPEET